LTDRLGIGDWGLGIGLAACEAKKQANNTRSVATVFWLVFFVRRLPLKSLGVVGGTKLRFGF